MANISLLLAFSAGLLSFLSPCVLPLIPAYLSYITGTTVSDLKRGEQRLTAFKKAIGFVAGFTVIFIVAGVSITYAGKLFDAHQRLLHRASGILIFLLGIHVTGIIPLKMLYREKRFIHWSNMAGTVSSLFMGMAFAIGWTPCIGPILTSILVYAASTATLGTGILLLTAYSLGMGIPFLFAAVLLESFSVYIKRISRFFSVIALLSGLLLMTMGVLTFFNLVNTLSRYFL